MDKEEKGDGGRGLHRMVLFLVIPRPHSAFQYKGGGLPGISHPQLKFPPLQKFESNDVIIHINKDLIIVAESVLDASVGLLYIGAQSQFQRNEKNPWRHASRTPRSACMLSTSRYACLALIQFSVREALPPLSPPQQKNPVWNPAFYNYRKFLERAEHTQCHACTRRRVRDKRDEGM